MRTPEELYKQKDSLYEEAIQNIIALMEENNLTEIKFDDYNAVWAVKEEFYGVSDIQVGSILLWKGINKQKFLSIYDKEDKGILEAFDWQLSAYEAVYNKLNNKQDE